MENMYWQTEGRGHHLDLRAIKAACFDLLNIFEANRALAEDAEGQLEDPDIGEAAARGSSLLTLHAEIADLKIRVGLLQLALLIRTYDDTMQASSAAQAYKHHAERTSGEDYIGGIEPEARFDVREACNKILHAREIRPLQAQAGASGLFHHYTGAVEISGKLGRVEWRAMLNVHPFIEVCLDRIQFGFGPEEADQR